MKNFIIPALAAAMSWASTLQAQDRADDILIVSVGESASLYSDVATHLEGLLAGVAEYVDSEVNLFEASSIESLADGFYDQNSVDLSLRTEVAEGYKHVLLIPTIITTPTGTIEYTEYNGGPDNVYDDAPYDNGYFAPEVFYEGCTQFSKLILNAGSTPVVFLPDNADETLADFAPVMQRVANGVGMELVPGAQAVDAAGTISDVQIQYLYACTIFTKLTDLNASVSSYDPAGLTSAEALMLEGVAESSVTQHAGTEHYVGSYETEGAVVYRSLDVTAAPFDDVVRYMYKGSSTHDWTKDALNKIINSNSATTSATRKLGTRNGETFGTRYWHPDDISDQGFKFALEPDEAAFMYVSGSWTGTSAQEVIDMDQANMVPFAFDWIKSFAISPAVSGTASTTDALDYHDCNELYFNYAERGWKLIPLTIGMGRLNEAVGNFVASDDALHCSDPLVYMNAYMMLSSALGLEFPLPDEITEDDIHRGSYTTEEIHQACTIGHTLIKELAYLSETGEHVPDSDLTILTDSLPDYVVGQEWRYQLSATGGSGAYSWELISSVSLPEGLSLSSDGLISGVVDTYGTVNLAFKVVDSEGAFRKLGLSLSSNFPDGEDLSFVVASGLPNAVYLPVYAYDGLVYSHSNPSGGTLSGESPYLTYTPNEGTLNDSFTYSLSGDAGVSPTRIVSVSVEDTGVYYDSFDADGALVNSRFGGGLVSRTIAGSKYWDDDGVLQYEDATGTHYLHRALVYSDSGFQVQDGFELKVSYYINSLTPGGASSLSFGLVSSETQFSTYSGLNPFGVESAPYSFGVNVGTANGGSNLYFTDGMSATALDPGDFVAGADTEVFISVTPDGAGGAYWYWSIGDVLQGSGKLEVFDFSKTYHFVAYGQDDQGVKRVNAVQLVQRKYNSFTGWSAYHNLGGDEADFGDDSIDQDGYSVLQEFALGGGPRVPDAGVGESTYIEWEGEMQYFVYEYARRTDYQTQGLSYALRVTEDLATVSAEEPFDISVGAEVDGFEIVKVRYPIDVQSKFIELEVSME